MRRAIALFLLMPLLALGCAERERNDAVALPEAGQAEPPSALPASVAGMFYPSNPEKLRADIEAYLESADVSEIEGEIVAAIVPHAGYQYSGPVAAYAYKAVARQVRRQPVEEKPEALVVLAFDHRGRHAGVSVYYKGAMETPLGAHPVNEKVAREFMNTHPSFSFSREAFRGEHSAEVQIPFIQTVLPDIPVVPVLFGRQGMANVEAVSKALGKIARRNRVLVIASTDLSHHHPYETATSMDNQIIETMLKGNPLEMAQFIELNYPKMRGPCGPGPVLAALSFAESVGATPVLLKYANSGDTAGPKSSVVGYAAVACVKKEQKASEESGGNGVREKAAADSPDYSLSETDKKTLLELARRSLESYVRDGKVVSVDPPGSEVLRENGAAFVTLRKHGRLRGCIGRMEPIMPLYETVIQMAVAAASEDRRFPPVRPEELDDIHIEISVNTPLRPVSGPEEIVMGKHGVVVAKGFRRGVFLPQVATESGWSKEQFLRNLCVHKAGLAPDAYKNDARLYVFSSIVFEEKK